MSFWEKIGQIDRRWIYLLVALAVIFPIVVPVQLPVGITPEARQLYDAVEALPDSCAVMLTFDYYPSTVAETMPMSVAALHHLFRKDIRIVTMTTVPLGGPSIAENVMADMAAQYGKEYGIDYVNLGYKANYTAVLLGMGASIESIYPADNLGRPLSELPLMQEVKNYDDIEFIFVVADNGIIDTWISIVNAQFGTPVGAGVTAVMAPKLYSFVESGQMTGLLGGMRGAAEYEILADQQAMAVMGMCAQSLVHLLIIFLIILGNIAFFTMKAKGRES
ncbi:MAG: hypothetical protein KAT58_10675 [candidate division Zixibacteria bacterium]|nr:hypothetical protein [candidate division Zixibacteria bacterium]